MTPEERCWERIERAKRDARAEALQAVLSHGSKMKPEYKAVVKIAVREATKALPGAQT